MKHIVLGLCCFCSTQFSILAQVAMPSLDLTTPVISSAAAAWEKVSYGTLSYYESSGDRRLDQNDTYKFDSDGVYATALYSAESFCLGGSYRDRTTDVKMSQTYDGEIPLEENEGRAYLALLLDGFATIGIGAYEKGEKKYLDTLNPSVETRQSAMSGSTSLRFMEYYYFGFQADRVRQKREDTVDNSWMDYTFGLAALFGQEGQTQLRVEYSETHSPRSEESPWDGKQGDVHPKTTISRGAVEIKIKGLLFSGKRTETIQDRVFTSMDNNQTATEHRRVETEGSVVWVPPQGLMLGFSFVQDQTEHVYEDSHMAFKINVGYLF